MGKEYEAKFLDIDYKKIIKILKKNGAKKLHNKKCFNVKYFNYVINQ